MTDNQIMTSQLRLTKAKTNQFIANFSGLSQELVSFGPNNSANTLNSLVLSAGTQALKQKLSNLLIGTSPGNSHSFTSKITAEKLFDATSSVKILTSQVAMHLDPELKVKIFSQIDSIHDIAEWDPDDKPVQNASFSTFLKAILFINPQRSPGLGLAHSGNLIAAWTTGKDRLTIEFLPKDQLKWVLAKAFEGNIERSAGQGEIKRLLECLAPYSPGIWFNHEHL